jgi:hypothetical protein
MKNAFFYFLVFPFFGLIQAMKNYKLPWAKNMVWLFVVFYGYTMFRPMGMDSYRYVLKLKELTESPRSWDSFLSTFFSVDIDGNVTFDIYQPLITNFVSLFTDNGNVLFAFFGLVYGYFYSRNIWFILSEVKTDTLPKAFWALFFSFVSIIGFWELNGVRMWTAAHVLFYGVYILLIKENKKGFIYILLTPLIHFSFALPVGLFFVYYLVKLPHRTFYYLYVASFFVSSLNVTVVGTFLEGILPEALLPKAKSYTGEEFLEGYVAQKEVTNWYVQYFRNVLNYSVFFLFTVIHFGKLKMYLENKYFVNFMNFSLLFLAIGNLLLSLPSGGRYLLIAQMFGLAVLLLFYIRYSSASFQKTLFYCTPLFVFYIIVCMRKAFDTISLMTLFTNPILSTIIDTPVPLIDLIK